MTVRVIGLLNEDGKSDRLKTEAICIYRGQEKEGRKRTVMEKQWPTLEEHPVIWIVTHYYKSWVQGRRNEQRKYA